MPASILGGALTIFSNSCGSEVSDSTLVREYVGPISVREDMGTQRVGREAVGGKEYAVCTHTQSQVGKGTAPLIYCPHT